jgi:hypothetical protein
MPERFAHYLGQRCVGKLPAKDRQTTTVMRAGVHVLLCYFVAHQEVPTLPYGIATKNEMKYRYKEVKGAYRRGSMIRHASSYVPKTLTMPIAWNSAFSHLYILTNIKAFSGYSRFINLKQK